MGRKSGKFINGIMKSIERRERVSFRKGSKIYIELRESNTNKIRKTSSSGSRRPSYRTGYSYSMTGIHINKIYEDIGYRKGINKRPRRKLTLGNIVIIKEIKRVDNIDRTNRYQIGKERERQRIRIYWDKRNLYRRYSQIEYRKYGKIRGREGIRDKKELIDGREVYIVIRECEVYRNGYERITIYMYDNRGRKERYINKYYWLRKEMNPGNNEKSIHLIKNFYKNRRKEREEKFIRKYKNRKERVEKYPLRKKVNHVKILIEKCEETIRKSSERKNQEKEENQGEEREKDKSREILRSAPTTQYFAKRKNPVRIIKEVGLNKFDMDKWSKVPENQRVSRKPEWSDLDKCFDRRMGKVEEMNRKDVIEGKEVDIGYAEYAELGKKAIYCYGSLRMDMWKNDNGSEIERNVERITISDREIIINREELIKEKDKGSNIYIKEWYKRILMRKKYEKKVPYERWEADKVWEKVMENNGKYRRKSNRDYTQKWFSELLIKEEDTLRKYDKKIKSYEKVRKEEKGTKEYEVNRRKSVKRNGEWGLWKRYRQGDEERVLEWKKGVLYKKVISGGKTWDRLDYRKEGSNLNKRRKIKRSIDYLNNQGNEDRINEISMNDVEREGWKNVQGREYMKKKVRRNNKRRNRGYEERDKPYRNGNMVENRESYGEERRGLQVRGEKLIRKVNEKKLGRKTYKKKKSFRLRKRINEEERRRLKEKIKERKGKRIIKRKENNGERSEEYTGLREEKKSKVTDRKVLSKQRIGQKKRIKVWNPYRNRRKLKCEKKKGKERR